MNEQEDYTAQLEQAYVQEQQRNQELASAMQSNFSQSEDNLIKYQLDLKQDLDRIHHLLKGDTIEEDGNGDIIYVKAKCDDDKPLNEFGVQRIMNLLQFYLNRNTLLSNYDEEKINRILRDLGMDLSDLIFNDYQRMGMDTKDKQKMYPLIIRQIIDTVENAYRRAFRGGERESIRTARQVIQQENPSGSQGQMMTPKPNKSLFKPNTWFN